MEEKCGNRKTSSDVLNCNFHVLSSSFKPGVTKGVNTFSLLTVAVDVVQPRELRDTGTGVTLNIFGSEEKEEDCW